MEIIPKPKRPRWNLTAEAFEQLLARLSDDREEAAREFEQHRRLLTSLLTYAGGADPEHLADIALDRAAKRLAEGEKIENLKSWLRGAARRVLQESWTSGKREADAAEATQATQKKSAEWDHEILADCLAQMAPASRMLIERYYQSKGESLPAARKQLAEELGTSIDNLRTRALRLRKILERCFEQRRAGTGREVS